MKTLFDHIQQYGQLNKAAQKSLEAALQKVELAKGAFLLQKIKMAAHLSFRD